MKRFIGLVAGIIMVGTVSSAMAQSVEPAPGAKTGAPLAMYAGGRTLVEGTADGPLWWRQWPGTYFETAFEGDHIFFRLGEGDVHLAVTVDGGAPVRLMKPEPGLYRIGDLGEGSHRVRVQMISENQDGPTAFGGFLRSYGKGTTALPLTPRARQIEFIGDSHTVGYGNISGQQECTTEEVWLTTDTARGPAGTIATRYDADYQVNAISGRGIVRNYNGHDALTLPQAYPHALLGAEGDVDDRGWTPELFVISLGTNDFTTALNEGEPWADRAALHADFIETYAAFVTGLREDHPGVPVVMWATGMADGEIARMGQAVADRLAGEGVEGVTFVQVEGLAMGGCHHHPDLADADRIAEALAPAIAALAPWREAPAVDAAPQ